MMYAQLTIFRRHEQLFKACPEEYERRLKLKKTWENESPAVQWLKQVYFKLRHNLQRYAR